MTASLSSWVRMFLCAALLLPTISLPAKSELFLPVVYKTEFQTQALIPDWVLPFRKVLIPANRVATIRMIARDLRTTISIGSLRLGDFETARSLAAYAALAAIGMGDTPGWQWAAAAMPAFAPSGTLAPELVTHLKTLLRRFGGNIPLVARLISTPRNTISIKVINEWINGIPSLPEELMKLRNRVKQMDVGRLIFEDADHLAKNPSQELERLRDFARGKGRKTVRLKGTGPEPRTKKPRKVFEPNELWARRGDSPYEPVPPASKNLAADGYTALRMPNLYIDFKGRINGPKAHLRVPNHWRGGRADVEWVRAPDGLRFWPVRLIVKSADGSRQQMYAYMQAEGPRDSLESGPGIPAAVQFRPVQGNPWPLAMAMGKPGTTLWMPFYQRVPGYWEEPETGEVFAVPGALGTTVYGAYRLESNDERRFLGVWAPGYWQSAEALEASVRKTSLDLVKEILAPELRHRTMPHTPGNVLAGMEVARRALGHGVADPGILAYVARRAAWTDADLGRPDRRTVPFANRLDPEGLSNPEAYSEDVGRPARAHNRTFIVERSRKEIGRELWRLAGGNRALLAVLVEEFNLNPWDYGWGPLPELTEADLRRLRPAAFNVARSLGPDRFREVVAEVALLLPGHPRLSVLLETLSAAMLMGLALQPITLGSTSTLELMVTSLALAIALFVGAWGLPWLHRHSTARYGDAQVRAIVPLFETISLRQGAVLSAFVAVSAGLWRDQPVVSILTFMGGIFVASMWTYHTHWISNRQARKLHHAA